jgi:asparagine synthase (glutamine-hydrolysing)
MQRQATRPVRTFTIGFDEAGFNEAEYAKAVAKHLGTEHTELFVTHKDAQAVIPQLGRIYSEPFADSSQIPTYLVSQMARRPVTVALSGDAGDELFAGYNRYFWARRIWDRVGWLPARTRWMLGRLIASVPAGAWDRLGRCVPPRMRISRIGDKAHKLAARLQTVNGIEELYRSLVSEWRSEKGIVFGAVALPTMLDSPGLVSAGMAEEERMMLWDAVTYLVDDILQKVDRAAMAVSLETRVPFLDHRVVELAWRIPLSMKIRDGKGKWVLRQVLDRYVPRNLIDRPKAGFDLPIGAWLRGPMRDWGEDLLSKSALESSGIFDADRIRAKWAEHLSGSRDWTSALWRVLMFQSWIEENHAPTVPSRSGGR